MSSFFENPFVEGNLSFSFGNTAGATRYETWHCHLHIFQQLKKKAVGSVAESRPSHVLVKNKTWI